MENEIKDIYNALSGGKIISSDSYIISSKHFNSITTDRFISELRKKGIYWDGTDIIYSELINKNRESIYFGNSGTDILKTNIEMAKENNNMEISSAGIDIQVINELPDTIDFWEEQFYISKFTSDEIAYCVSKNNPKQSFSGLYSCKEAIIKCNNQIRWDEINILHDINGKPKFKDFNLSISHSNEYSVAIAIIFKIGLHLDNKQHQPNATYQITHEEKKSKKNLILFSFIIAITIYILLRDFIKL
jgi:phosphopantetheine--protein transferase-like protein